MATITFNISAAQAQRIQEATDIDNANEETSLTSKQWAWRELKLVVRRTVLSNYEDTAFPVLVDAVDADMEGDA